LNVWLAIVTKSYKVYETKEDGMKAISKKLGKAQVMWGTKSKLTGTITGVYDSRFSARFDKLGYESVVKVEVKEIK